MKPDNVPTNWLISNTRQQEAYQLFSWNANRPLQIKDASLSAECPYPECDEAEDTAFHLLA